ncbi:hypothetical protein GGTG_11803 [Gaeumannomyces tritici R3-111a-1]|uniref:Uncharacterized protein n=1 Tax=Gaeumannomyces tritici (strain R3-111a-1) TaxID=644352 RepID=J3PE80_GAET3|nr:hypothetical protein GGTG_11803 [Gaeumannomyces tritici R3-111a-1]EJT70780.1 hypothetical protein GGTG_11803 [Gaeumannomyces tritici R3-111a-1]
MKSFSLFALTLAAVAIAAPTTANEPATQLNAGEYILVNGDHHEVINETRLNEYLEKEGILREPPPVDAEWLKFTPDAEALANLTKLEARQASCQHTVSIIQDKKQRFTDWDVQMSSVVIGAGRSGIQFTVDNGWSVSNAVTVSAGLDLGVVKERVGATLGINYSKTWTSSFTERYTITVNEGEAGVWTSQPWTNRVYGRTFRGCPGSLVQTGTWMADSREDGQYFGHKWVSGYISACIKKVPRGRGGLTRCHGSGEFK